MMVMVMMLVDVRAGGRKGRTPKNIMNVISDVIHVMELVDMSLS